MVTELGTGKMSKDPGLQPFCRGHVKSIMRIHRATASKSLDPVFFGLIFKNYLFIHLWLCLVFIAVHRLSLTAACGL